MTELNRDKCSVAYAPLTETKHKSGIRHMSQIYFLTMLTTVLLPKATEQSDITSASSLTVFQ